MAKFPTLNKTDPHTLAPCCTPPSTLTTMHKPNVQFQGLLRDHFKKLEGGEDILGIVSLKIHWKLFKNHYLPSKKQFLPLKFKIPLCLISKERFWKHMVFETGLFRETQISNNNRFKYIKNICSAQILKPKTHINFFCIIIQPSDGWYQQC